MIQLSHVVGKRGIARGVRKRCAACCIALTVSSLCVAVVHAAPEQDTERAERFFVQGRSAMRALRYEEACAKFSESHHVDPASGTLLNLAVCREAQGRTATAWKHYQEALALSLDEKNLEGERFARERLQALEAILCRLTIEPPATGRADLAVMVDGIKLESTMWGSARPVDPGTHVVVASAPRRKSWTGRVTLIEQGSRLVLRIPTLEMSSPRAPARAGSSHRTAGADFRWDVAIPATVSVTGFASMAYFGLRAKSEWDTRNRHCAGGSCDDHAVDASERSSKFARVSNVSAAVGIVGAGVAAYFLVFPARWDAASSLPVNARVTRDYVDVVVGGRF
jgi:hypothetical protein